MASSACSAEYEASVGLFAEEITLCGMLIKYLQRFITTNTEDSGSGGGDKPSPPSTIPEESQGRFLVVFLYSQSELCVSVSVSL